ncbi:MAG: hypothetical protein A2X55_08995 [Nitrospirae bacterium GWB2_47_37]|nr:MAG: hypothetical protein A2X55_08995 [Nitrospirae bacterium GWB2_47_37]HAK87647.1 hypothetical protein [Nitrospiraceae bacterium]
MREFKKIVSEEGLMRVREMLSGHIPQIKPAYRYYIAVEDGKIKGCVGLKRQTWYMTEIKHLYVKEEYRNQGIGNFLVKEVLKRIKAPVVCCTIAGSNDSNDWSCWIFEGVGFSKRETFVNPDTGHTVSFLTVNMDVVREDQRREVES